VVNHAAGRGESRTGIRLERIEQMLHSTIARARRIVEELVALG